VKKTNDLFQEILRRGPSPSTLFLLLSKMRDEGRFNAVVQECQKALSIYPDDLRLRTLLAESYLELGFIGLAEAELTAVTQSLGDVITAYKLQADLFSQQRRTDEAFEALNQYLAHRPDDQSALDMLEKLSPLAEEGLTEEPQADQALRPWESGLDEEQALQAEEAFENELTPVEEEADGKPPAEGLGFGGSTVQAADDDLEAAHVIESPDIPEELVRAAEQVFEEESILESTDFREEVDRSYEGDMEEPSVAETAAALDTRRDSEEDEFGELATPELAEIYFHQGLVNEAISTYEKVLSEKPEDEAVRKRLAELKAANEDDSVPEASVDEILRARKERMIVVMKDWLAKIQELSEAR
jgi:tetratricopeptide (TPR) repeat protein